jgi:CRISPR-associated protein Cas5h
MQELISIDLIGDFGFFRKPDTNSTVNISYSMLHKPALLGLFGAIIGLEGYKEKGKMPAYFDALDGLKIGVEPLYHEMGNYQKTTIKYSNTVGYANNGSTYLTEESTLIKPAYRVYALLDMVDKNHNLLFEYLRDGKAEFLPYFGKNEFAAWWDKESFTVYSFQDVEKPSESLSIKTLFLKKDVIKEHKADPIFDFSSFMDDETPFMYFERLPIGFDTELFQYQMGDFVLSTFKLLQSVGIDNLYYLNQEKYYVQLL